MSEQSDKDRLVAKIADARARGDRSELLRFIRQLQRLEDGLDTLTRGGSEETGRRCKATRIVPL